MKKVIAMLLLVFLSDIVLFFKIGEWGFFEHAAAIIVSMPYIYSKAKSESKKYAPNVHLFIRLIVLYFWSFVSAGFYMNNHNLGFAGYFHIFSNFIVFFISCFYVIKYPLVRYGDDV